jgi:DNA polymerase III epsilon subunit-like protein
MRNTLSTKDPIDLKTSVQKMALIDLEWTSDPNSQATYLIEIAVIIMHSTNEGWIEVERYDTLLNPDTHLCPRISELTGITQGMLESAPRLSDTVDHLKRLTQGCAWVAHGAQKDQQMLEAALQRIGHELQGPWLCTLERAKQEWSELNHYDLESLSLLIGHRLERQHRALNDVLALKELFQRLIRAPRRWEALKKNNLRDDLPHLKDQTYKTYEDIPEISGTFSFYEQKKLLFLGVAQNLRREIQKLAPKLSHSTINQLIIEAHEHELMNIIITHSLAARFNPSLNKYQEEKKYWGLYSYRDSRGVMQLKLRKINQQKRFPLEAFSTKEEGLKRMTQINRQSLHIANLKFKTPSEIQLINQEREQTLDRLSLPFENARISLKNNSSEWIQIEKGRLTRFKRKGKETSIRETLEMRTDFMRRYREIKTRSDHPYVFLMLKSRHHLVAAPSAGRRSPEKTRTGTLDSAAIS